MIPFSVLDLSPINQGSTAAQAFNNSKELAQRAEARVFEKAIFQSPSGNTAWLL